MRLGGVVLLVLALTAGVTSEVIQSGHKLTKMSADAVQEDVWEDIVPADKRWKRDDIFSDVRMSAESLKKDAERWGVDDIPRRMMAGRHKAKEEQDYSWLNHKGVTSTIPIVTLNPVFTKVSNLKQALKHHHQTFDRLRKHLLKQKNDGNLIFKQAEILLEHTDDAENHLRKVQTLMEPFTPFDHEKATYPPGSLARIEFIEDKMRLCLRECNWIWRTSMSTMRQNRANWGIQTPVSRGSPSRGKRNAETSVDAKANLQCKDEVQEIVQQLKHASVKAVKFSYILIGVLAGTFLLTGFVIVCVIRYYQQESIRLDFSMTPSYRKKRVKIQMAQTWPARWKFILEGPPVKEILEEWPGLQFQDCVLHDFMRLTNISLEGSFLSNFDEVTPKILKLGAKKRELTDLCNAVPDDIMKKRELAIDVLRHLLGEKEHSPLIKVFEGDVDKEQVLNLKDCTIIKTEEKYELLVEKALILTDIDNLINAVYLMFAFIWVLNLQYPKDNKYVWEFIEKIVLKIGKGNLSAKIALFQEKLNSQ